VSSLYLHQYLLVPVPVPRLAVLTPHLNTPPPFSSLLLQILFSSILFSPLLSTPALSSSLAGVDIHQQGTMVRNFTRKKKDSNYGKAVTTNSLMAESISVAKVNPDGDMRDRRTIEEIQQVSPPLQFTSSHSTIFHPSLLHHQHCTAQNTLYSTAPKNLTPHLHLHLHPPTLLPS
jgi:hypothetical protein